MVRRIYEKNEEIHKSVFLVANSTNESWFVTGFIIGYCDNCATLLLTCGHGLNQIKEGNLIFESCPAKIIAIDSKCDPDLAILLVEKKLKGLELNLRLNVNSEDIRNVTIHGFRELAQRHQLITLNASDPQVAPLVSRHGKLRAWNFTIDDGAIVPGNSGSPVTIPGSKDVIGVAIIQEGSEKVTVISVDAIRHLKLPDEVLKYLWSNLNNGKDYNYMADIFQKYKTAKEEVLNLYESYKNLVKNNVNLDLLETKISRVKEKKYTLVVAGEVKSGKSTFINALLGEMVLPTGILQNTSSIIEIFSNKQKIVQVEYDDGTSQEVDESTTNITEFLEQIAAIQEKYREIPFQQLKKFLIKNNDQPIDNETIPDFIEDLYENDNDHHLSKEKFQELTRNYLDEYRALKRIPIKIKLGFPHSVEDAIERKSFQDFTTKVASTKSNEVMFLVLTKAGNRNSREVEAKLKDVISRLGKGTLNPERITYFDSLLKIIADHAKEFETFESLMEFYEKQTQDFEERLDDDNSNLLNEYLLWDTKLSLLGQLKYRKPKDENGISFRDLILERSNFNVVETKLSQFASKAPFAKLFKIISVIKADYENQKQDYLERIDLLEKRNKPAEQFKREIDELQKKLDEYKSSLENFLIGIRKNKLTAKSNQFVLDFGWRTFFNFALTKLIHLLFPNKLNKRSTLHNL